MKSLDANLVRQGLRTTGQVLAQRGQTSPIRLIVGGGAAGLLGGHLNPARTTGDCDVFWNKDEAIWNAVAAAAAVVAHQLQLPERWLNRDCSIHAWCLALGWERRCEQVGTFGPLAVARLARLDLIAAKFISFPKRPQDVEDLHDLAPTSKELDFIERHIDRLESEDPDRNTYEPHRELLAEFRGAP